MEKQQNQMQLGDGAALNVANYQWLSVADFMH